MIKKDLSIDFLGVHFENPFCLSSSPVGNCYDMCAKAYDEAGAALFSKLSARRILKSTKSRLALMN